MNFSTNKEKGNAGLSMAIAYFGTHGYIVSLPLNDTQDYDLVVDKDGVIQRVQCKATNEKRENGNYSLPLASCGGTNGHRYKTVVNTDVDLIFALRGDGIMYIIPTDNLRNVSSVALTTEKSKFANKNTFDTSPYIVSM